MRARQLGGRRREAVRPRPVELPRLWGRVRLPVARLEGAPPVAAEMPLRLLVKLAAGSDGDAVVDAVRTSFVPRAGLRDARLVGARVRIRPLGRRLADGGRWVVVELPVSLGGLLEEVDYSLDELDELRAELARLPGVAMVELDLPAENLVRPLQESIPGCTAGRDAAPGDVDWAPRLVGLFELPAPAPTGAGVRIGHIDSGFTDHPELDLAESYDLPASTSTIDGGGGLDPMPGGSSHGTATGTVIVSRHGTQATDDTGAPSPGISGLAVGATVVEARTLDSVVVAEIPVLVPSAIAAAVHHCLEQGCDVITMSFGGLVSEAVKDALREAHANDVILCAAAGNCVGFVVEPAVLPEVIGCGGVGIDAATGAVHPWTGTSEGPQVVISAPAENVWIGDWVDGDPVVRPGEGTSFAAPHVAAAAALWLEHHGRLDLLAAVDGTEIRLGDVFREVLRRSAAVPAGWDTERNGAGVLDLGALLAEPLPGPDELEGAPPPPPLDLIPDLAEPVEAVVDIDHLTVRDDGELFGGAEPYLLLTFFTVDGRSARAELELDASDLFGEGPRLRATMHPAEGSEAIVSTRRRGRHGDVDAVNIGPIELATGGPLEVAIDSSVGVFRTELEPIPVRVLLDTGDLVAGLDLVGLPGFIGVHALLMEEDLTPPQAAVAAHRVVADGIAALLEDVLAELDLADLSADPAAFVERAAEIEDAARQAAASQMNWWELLWGGLVDPDDQLIQAFAIANVLQLGSPMPLEARYQGPHGDWILVGEIRLA